MQKILFASLLAFLPACGNDNGGDVPDGGGSDSGECSVQASFTSLHGSLLSTNRCAIPGCHAAMNSQGNLSFEASKAAVYASLTAMDTFNAMAAPTFPKRVVPTAAEMSYLYVKVSETMPIGGGSGRMPPGLPLADCEIQAIRDWIEAGAPND